MKWSQIEEIIAQNSDKVANDDIFQIIELFTDFEIFKQGMLKLDKDQGPMGIAVFMINKGYFKGESDDFVKKNQVDVNVAGSLSKDALQNLTSQLDEMEKTAQSLLDLPGAWKEQYSQENLKVHTQKNKNAGVDTFRIESKIKYPIDTIVKATKNEDFMKKLDDNCQINQTIERLDENTVFTKFVSKDFKIVSAREIFSFNQNRKFKNGRVSLSVGVPKGVHPKDSEVKAIRATIFIWAVFYLPDENDPETTKIIRIRQYSMNGMVPSWIQNKIGLSSAKNQTNLGKVMKEFGY